MKKVFVLFLVIVLIIAAVCVGCEKEKSRDVRLVEVTHSVFYAPQYVAIEKGFFEEVDINIELTNGAGADKSMTALLSGQADIGFMGPEASVYVYNQGKEDYAVNFAQLTQKDGSFIVGREIDNEFTFEKMRNKSILGGRIGGVPEMTLEYILKNNGLIPGEDIEVRTDIQFAMMAGSFTSGEGDYTTLFEPTASMIEAEGKGYIVASVGKEAGYIPYTCYCANKSYIEENPEIIQDFTNAIYKGMLWVQEHSAREVAEVIMPQFLDSDIELLTTVVQRYKDQDTWRPDPVLTEEGYNHLMDIIELAGELDERAPYDKVVSTDFAEKAVETVK